ncbi:D-2-hydroxyacid dehydrogenase, partial [Kaarinaea lacus]
MAVSSGVFLDIKSLDREDLDLSELYSVLHDWQMHDYSSASQVAERIREAHVVVANKAPLTKDILQQAPQLQLICVAATGINNVDLDAAKRKGITVCNVRDYASGSVVQHVFMLMLNLCTQFLNYQEALKRGRWQTSDNFCLLDYPIHELAGKNLGIIGYGVLGHAVAAVGEAFGMKVLIAERKGAAPRRGRVSFDDVLTQADVISIHCPLIESTRGLIAQPELERMKKSALLINAARGGIVDEAALVDAIRQGQIAGAGFDVLTTEP